MWIKDVFLKIKDTYKSGSRLKKVFLTVELCAICGILITGTLLCSSLLKVRQSRELNEHLQETVTVTQTAARPPAAPSASPAPTDRVTAWRKKTGEAPIKVDFVPLEEQNRDILAWIYLEGTDISYPVVWRQGDNEYYLDRLFDGSENPNGTIFVDGRTEKPFEDGNTIIYGHNMLDGTMFGEVDKYITQSYWEKHPTMYLIQPDRAFSLDICYAGIFQVDTELFDFPVTGESMEAVLAQMKESNRIDTGIEPTTEDRLVTLSTCWGQDSDRIIVIGVLSELTK